MEQPQVLSKLFSLETLTLGRYRSITHDPNPTGFAFGGQVMAQAVVAAGYLVSPDRRLSAVQVLFLKGSKVSEPIDYFVEKLQEGRRLSLLHVRASQGDVPCLDVQITFRSELTGPSHHEDVLLGAAAPEQLPRLSDMSPEWRSAVDEAGYPIECKPWLDLRLVGSSTIGQSEAFSNRLFYWTRVNEELPSIPHIQEAALVYLSDSWINFPSLAPHITHPLQQTRYNVVTLNHAIWIYDDFEVDTNSWLLVASTSPIAQGGRSWVTGYFYGDKGSLVAIATQECMLVPA